MSEVVLTGRPLQRHRIWDRQGRKCFYCGMALAWYQGTYPPPWDIHHVRDTHGNCVDKVVTCRPCHASFHKADSDSRGALWRWIGVLSKEVWP